MSALETKLDHPASLMPGAAPLGVDDLEALMRAVNETTAQLQHTHVTLRNEVARLQRELAEANARLRRSEALAALGEMAAGIAHEIRNPLGVIQLNAQNLREEVAGDPDRVAFCERIGDSVRRMDGIVRDVLLFARELRIRPAPTSAAELVRDTLAGCEALLAERPAGLVLDVPDREDLRLEADLCLMSQALGNVVRNAVEAAADTPTGAPRLAITARRRSVRCPDGRPAPRIVIAVADSGPGVPPDVLERMFNPFFTTRPTGTGLGLAIVHRIVDGHGGHINVTNPRRGGARIELCLPPRPPRPDLPPSPGGDELHLHAGTDHP